MSITAYTSNDVAFEYEYAEIENSFELKLTEKRFKCI